MGAHRTGIALGCGRDRRETSYEVKRRMSENGISASRGTHTHPVASGRQIPTVPLRLQPMSTRAQHSESLRQAATRLVAKRLVARRSGKRRSRRRQDELPDDELDVDDRGQWLRTLFDCAQRPNEKASMYLLKRNRLLALLSYVTGTRMRRRADQGQTGMGNEPNEEQRRKARRRETYTPVTWASTGCVTVGPATGARAVGPTM
ncbi:hypothetical protein EXIGLDRAFT_40594 [Exidia glandulosa HHB12029]|uniref:Uncharacterized protein n=1 Tax=Exidia glandulosa HHB12029 TaxID=1314781 RepID=A0A166AN18_EXIGL|nr:hypothetical protein EXIGLDRAFT_40594 [Exidia glandulosa HHB12029]